MFHLFVCTYTLQFHGIHTLKPTKSLLNVPSTLQVLNPKKIHPHLIDVRVPASVRQFPNQ